jgi:hypothetical protein
MGISGDQMTDPARAARLTADPVKLQLDTLRGFDDSFDLTVSLGVLRCLVAEKEQAEQQRDAAHAALTKHGSHSMGCAKVTRRSGTPWDDEPCTCGLDAALAASAPQKECDPACGPSISTWHVTKCPNAPDWLKPAPAQETER